jgi:hypothetical protein
MVRRSSVPRRMSPFTDRRSTSFWRFRLIWPGVILANDTDLPATVNPASGATLNNLLSSHARQLHQTNQCCGFDSCPFRFRFGFVQQNYNTAQQPCHFCCTDMQTDKGPILSITADSDLEPALASPPSEARRAHACSFPPSLRFSLRHLAVHFCAGK